MFRDTKTFVALLVTIVLLGFLVGKLDLGRTTYVATLSPQGSLTAPVPQDVRERTWATKPTKLLKTLGEDPILAGPLQLKVDDQGHLFVADFNQGKVFQYSEAGEPLKTFGNGHGEGPGEFQTLMDFTVSPSNVWVTDTTNGAISVFSREGTLVDTLKTPQQIFRLASAEDNIYGMTILADKMFSGLQRTPEGKLEIGPEFGQILEKQVENGVLLDGWIEPGPGGTLVYVPAYLSFFIVFDAQGQMLLYSETIDPHPIPEIIQEEKTRWVDRVAPVSALGSSISGDELHIVTVVDWDAIDKIGAIDAYSLVDGRYLYSMRVPEPCEDVIVTDRYVYTVLEDTIRQWERES